MSASPYDVECPVCHETAGRHCVAMSTGFYIYEVIDNHLVHSARITDRGILAQPQPTDVQRFAERLADALSEEVETSIIRADQNEVDGIDEHLVRMERGHAATCATIAAIVRRITKESM